MVLSWGKALQRRILNLLVDKTVFLTLAGLLTLILISIAWLGEKWIVVSKRIEMLISSKKKSITIYNQDNANSLQSNRRYLIYRSDGLETSTKIYSIHFLTI